MLRGVLMSRQAALATMRNVVGLWYVDQRSAADVVSAACDLLVAGFDGPALRELAAAPPDVSDFDVTDLLEPALQVVGLPYHPKTSLPPGMRPWPPWPL